MDITKDKCTICNETNFSKIQYGNHLNKINRTYIKHSIASIILPILRLFHSRYYNWLSMKMLFSPFFHIMKCNFCGYGKYGRQISSVLVEKYYNTVYWNAAGLPSAMWHQEALYLENPRANGQYHCVYEWIKQYDELNILEIGAGSALFSRVLKHKHSREVHLSAIEPGNGWHSYYASIGISLLAKYFPFESSQKFHYIHTSHWFEHVLDIDGALNVIRGILVENGLLFIEVPNCNDEYFLLDTGDTPHIHFFTKKSLCILLENNGFKTLTIDEYGLTNREEYERRIDPKKFSNNLLGEEHISVKENIPRPGGACLRALFQLSEQNPK